MKILAIETTELVGTVAAAGESLLADKSLEPTMRSARSLAPAIQKMLAELSWKPNDVDLVAVTRGPGSFTGLRVGIATAKTFAYATGADVLGVDTLGVIAEQVPGEVRRVSAAVDAQRGQVVCRTFSRAPEGTMSADAEAEILSLDDWLTSIPEGTWISGPILRRKRGQVPPATAVVPDGCWAPRAATVAKIAWSRYQAGERDDLWQLVPVYSRKSAAEEKWEARRS